MNTDAKPVEDWVTMVGMDWDLRVESADPRPLDEQGLRKRLVLTGLALAQALLAVPALALFILSLLSIPLAPLGVGLVIAHGVVPATEALTRLHRRLAGMVLGEEIPASYAEGSGAIRGPVTWFRDRARWRDFAFLAFSATGGFVLSVVVPGLLANPVTSLVGLVLDGGWTWAVLTFVLAPVCVTTWWLVTPGLVRGRALAERGILGARAEELERRVAEVTTTRTESLDHSAAEIRRIERDLHDGAQARIVSLGMNLGLAEQLVGSDPDAATALLREARESTVTALEDIRSVVRGIHPPVLADRGLLGAVEALTMSLALPITVTDQLPGRAPAPIESAVYFAIVECLANTAKHAQASRAWVRLSHQDGRLRVVVGDDGQGGADAEGSGLAGVRSRLAAFDGTILVESPDGGPTVVSLEVPCALSSPRTTPSSGKDSPGS